MGTRKKFKKKADSFVVAVQLNLDTDGFTYEKWGAEQRCKKGDWLYPKEMPFPMSLADYWLYNKSTLKKNYYHRQKGCI